MKSKNYIMPGLILAALIIGGGSAHAHSGGGKVPSEVSRGQFREKFQDKFKVHREEVRAAIEAEDYEAFVKAVEGTPGEGKVTEEQFAKFIEAHVLMQSGDKAGAFEIMKEVGFKGMRGHMMHKMKVQSK